MIAAGTTGPVDFFMALLIPPRAYQVSNAYLTFSTAVDPH